ncbi:putative holin [Acidovorax sp. SUPP2825]|uniref:putative holin n=1 Tax=Acidovorax sp. SUPP2825 TaxID=2920879 RepID=UPI0023DE51C4|nr:putative holin [Acidovorax sp. SUPP2825]GKS97002.1 putative holin [Acidovorax sp. SUPP2825]
MQDDDKATPWLVKFARVRMADWVIAAVLLTILVALLAPQQIPVSLYKLSLVALAAVSGYWIDRSLFPYARPDLFFELRHGAGEVPQETTFTSLEGAVSFAEKAVAINLANARPDELMRLAGVSMLRRAAIVAATMLAVGLGA